MFNTTRYTKSDEHSESLISSRYDELDRIQYCRREVLNHNKKAYLITVKYNKGLTAYCSDYYGILYQFFTRGEVLDFSYELDKKDRWHIHLIYLCDKCPFWRSFVTDGYHINAKKIFNLQRALDYTQKDNMSGIRLFQEQDAHWYRHNFGFHNPIK